jgi:hypothetical protein
MDSINGESVHLKKNKFKVEERLVELSLKDVPREVRRKEAKEPLFLSRYE